MTVRLGPQKSRAQKNWCFWTVELEQTLENSLNCTEIRTANLNGYQSWIFTGRTDTEAEEPRLWPPDVKNGLIGKYPDAAKDWRQEKEMTGWDGWMASPIWWTWAWASSAVGAGQGSLAAAVRRPTKSWAWLSNWTKLITFGPRILGKIPYLKSTH